MTSDLHARLHELTADAPAPSPALAGDLWRAGKRRQRRSRAAGAIGALAVVAATTGGVSALLPSDSGAPALPAAERGDLALPDELHRPSRWTRSNSEDPVGPFAALLQPVDGLGWSGHHGYVGVSAMTGEYRAVELPAMARDAGFSRDAVLSPDGRYIAFWTLLDPDAPDLNQDPVAGPAVYDTVTGDVHGRVIDSERGVLPWDLRWVDGRRLYVQAGEIDELTADTSGSHATGAGWIWSPAAGGWDELDVPGMAKTGEVVASDGQGRLVLDAKGRGPAHLYVDPARPDEARRIQVRLPGNGTGSELRASTEGRVAIATMTEGGSRAYLGVAAPDGTARAFEDIAAWDVFGWRDATHLVANVAADGANEPPRIVAIDVTTGDTEPFIALPDDHLNPPQLASQLLDEVPVDRPVPDQPTDPRALLAGGAAVLLLGLVALRAWRRRVGR